MEYKVIAVHGQHSNSCCGGSPKSLVNEIQDTCNEMANLDFVLITIYPEEFEAKGCGETIFYRGAVMVFGRKK